MIELNNGLQTAGYACAHGRWVRGDGPSAIAPMLLTAGRSSVPDVRVYAGSKPRALASARRDQRGLAWTRQWTVVLTEARRAGRDVFEAAWTWGRSQGITLVAWQRMPRGSLAFLWPPMEPAEDGMCPLVERHAWADVRRGLDEHARLDPILQEVERLTGT